MTSMVDAEIFNYSPEAATLCERVLLSLLQGLEMPRGTVYLIGGLVPRYLVNQDGGRVEQHAGTLDIDMVISLNVLMTEKGYESLKANLTRLQFNRHLNKKVENFDDPDEQYKQWTWYRAIDGLQVGVDILTDGADRKVVPHPGWNGIAALQMPFVEMVYDLYDSKAIQHQLLDGEQYEAEIRYANVVCFTVLKALAFNNRKKDKDAYDLVYCIEGLVAQEGFPPLLKQFRDALDGGHRVRILEGLDLIWKGFVGDTGEGHELEGPVAVARFQGDRFATEDERVARQRDVTILMRQLISAIRTPEAAEA